LSCVNISNMTIDGGCVLRGSTLQAGVCGDAGRESGGQGSDGDGVVGGGQEAEADVHPLGLRGEELLPLVAERALVLPDTPVHHLCGSTEGSLGTL